MTSDLSNLLHHEDQINVVFYICVLVLGSVDQGETKLVHFTRSEWKVEREIKRGKQKEEEAEEAEEDEPRGVSSTPPRVSSHYTLQTKSNILKQMIRLTKYKECFCSKLILLQC